MLTHFNPKFHFYNPRKQQMDYGLWTIKWIKMLYLLLRIKIIQTCNLRVKWSVLPENKDRRTCYFVLLVLTYVNAEIRNPN